MSVTYVRAMHVMINLISIKGLANIIIMCNCIRAVCNLVSAAQSFKLLI